MKTFLSATIAIISGLSAYSQDFNVHISNANTNGIITICPNDETIFEADVDTDDPINYIWDFDNGDRLTTQDKTISYRYSSGGAYIITLTAYNDNFSTSTSAKAIVGAAPSFSVFKSDLPEKNAGICLGETVTLNMPIHDSTITYHYRNTFYETSPQILYGNSWTGNIYLKGFLQSTITNPATDIVSVSTTMWSTTPEDLQISIQSPQGVRAILKEYNTPLPDGISTAYNYNNIPLKEYIFTPQNISSLSNLQDNTIDGRWQIIVETQGNIEETKVLGCELNLSDEISQKCTWEYNQKYDLRRAVWSGKGISATSEGISQATPQQDGTTRYSFTIGDDYGCFHDTTIYISVERASASAGEPDTYIGDEINFTNNTSWSKETEWIFGDETPNTNGSPSPHAYYERGKYMVIMTAKSAQGCIDIDTQYVNIIPRPLEIKEINIFTPNGDGVNDLFTFFNEKESFLSNGGLTQMPANIRSLRCKIYNSYGQTICKWDNVEPSIFGWDGTIDNKGTHQCPPGTYYYDLIVYGKDGTSIKRTGTILLYRSK